MLPFQITTFDETLDNFAKYYIQTKGYNSYEKLCRKIEQSNSLAQIFSTTLRLRTQPGPINFNIAASNTFIFASTEKITLAALVALKLWDERINKVYKITHFDDDVENMFKGVMRESKLAYI